MTISVAKIPAARYWLPLSLTLLLAACSPHPGAGRWEALEENESGIHELVLAFDGRAQFATAHPKASWHCFWNARKARLAELSCTPSSHPDNKTSYHFRVEENDIGILGRDGKVMARFRRLPGKPEIP